VNTHTNCRTWRKAFSLTAAYLKTEVGKNMQRKLKVTGLNTLQGRARGKIISFNAFCDAEPKLNTNLCAKYLYATVGLYADP